MTDSIIFENSPDVDKIMAVLCELMARGEGGEYEYTYKLVSDTDTEVKNAG